MKKTALVTGSSGFIGFHLCKLLLSSGFKVVGVDAHDDYYDVGLKDSREQILNEFEYFTSLRGRLETPNMLLNIFEEHRPHFVIHLAGQAGVRYSIDNPRAYIDSNIVGTFEILEAARAFKPIHLLMASTSSVYGANEIMPYRELDKADTQMSFYAATKKSNEVMAHSYSHLYNIPITMFRFFTVYGPWGRPDMALFKFVRAIFDGEPIDVYNHGNMKRDFTYVDDLVKSIQLLFDAIPDDKVIFSAQDSVSKVAPWRVVNIGNASPISLMQFISAIETATGITARKNFLPMQAGDVPATWANTDLLHNLTGYTPQTSIDLGVQKFVEWYKEYYEK